MGLPEFLFFGIATHLVEVEERSAGGKSVGLTSWLRHLFCGKPQQKEQPAPESGPFGAVAKVKVDRKGRIHLDGQVTSLEGLKAQLARVKAVFYFRENPEKDPPPHLAAVIDSVVAAIVAERLPVKLEEKDFE